MSRFREEALKELEKKDLSEFIRMKREVNKEMILQNPERFKNFKSLFIDQEEIFAIVLSSLGVERQKGKTKFKKVDIK